MLTWMYLSISLSNNDLVNVSKTAFCCGAFSSVGAIASIAACTRPFASGVCSAVVVVACSVNVLTGVCVGTLTALSSSSAYFLRLNLGAFTAASRASYLPLAIQSLPNMRSVCSMALVALRAGLSTSACCFSCCVFWSKSSSIWFWFLSFSATRRSNSAS